MEQRVKVKMRSERSLYYRETEDGGVEPVPRDQWRDAFRDLAKTKRVDRTQVGDYEVSTVFLCIDHGFGEGDPVLYETMVFKGDLTDLFMDRYTSRSEAQKGHNRVVNELRMGRKPEDL